MKKLFNITLLLSLIAQLPFTIAMDNTRHQKINDTSELQPLIAAQNQPSDHTTPYRRVHFALDPEALGGQVSPGIPSGAQIPLKAMDQKSSWTESITKLVKEGLQKPCENATGTREKIYKFLYWSSLIGFNLASVYTLPGDNPGEAEARTVLQLIVADTITKSLENKNSLLVTLGSLILGSTSDYVLFDLLKFRNEFGPLGFLTAATTVTDRLKKIAQVWYGDKNLNPVKLSETIEQMNSFINNQKNSAFTQNSNLDDPQPSSSRHRNNIPADSENIGTTAPQPLGSTHSAEPSRSGSPLLKGNSSSSQ